MATLTPLTVSAAASTPQSATTWTTSTYTLVDEPFASPTGDEIGSDQNVTGDYFANYALTNVNSDLGSMTTLALSIYYRVTGAQTNERYLYATIFTDTATPVQLTNKIALNSGNPVTSTSTSNNQTNVAFTIQGTPTKAQWDSAYIELDLYVLKNKGGDTNGIRVDTLEVTGTYAIATANTGAFFAVL